LFDVALQGGAAIIIVSTDFEEVAKVCHRALIFNRGRVVAELAAGDLSVENLLAAASASIRRSEPLLGGSSCGFGVDAVH
jgi:ribose transport system ATP-binding protein